MNHKEPTILAIDTSCDDTSIAILRGNKVLSSEVSSQVEIHAEWGGVVPDIARREHEKNIPLVYEEALRKARVTIDEIEYIACTYGPGLAIDLEVGLNLAKQLAIKHKIPFIPVNHMEGHLLSGLLGTKEETKFPALALLISGKHTEIIYVKDIGIYNKLGETLDDAAGEALDKVARMLDLGYPGGPVICEFAKKGVPGNISLPIPMKNSNDLNFSYSGLKTAALYKIEELKEEQPNVKEWVYDFCRAFLDSIKESIKLKLELAIQEYPEIKTLFVGGGVFNSEEIVRYIGKIAKSYDLNYIYPKKEYRGDNAAMVGVVAYYKIFRNEYMTETSEIESIDRNPRLRLGS